MCLASLDLEMSTLGVAYRQTTVSDSPFHAWHYSWHDDDVEIYLSFGWYLNKLFTMATCVVDMTTHTCTY